MNTNDMNIKDFAQYVETSVQEWADNNDTDINTELIRYSSFGFRLQAV